MTEKGADNVRLDDKTTTHRRARLRELVSSLDGQINLIRRISRHSGKEMNQGLLSALAKDNSGKPFREVKARNLEDDSGLPNGWFDLPLGTALPTARTLEEPMPATYSPRLDEESRLLRAFRLADPILRQSLIRQADWILESLDTPSRLNGIDKSKPG